MYAQVNKQNNNKSETVSNSVVQNKSSENQELGIIDSRIQSSFVDNRSIKSLQRQSADNTIPNSNDLFGALQLAQNESANESKRNAPPITVQQLKKKLAHLDASESLQFKSGAFRYNTTYAESIPQNIGIKGSQIPIAETAQLQALGVVGYTANTKTAVSNPIVQMVRTPDGLQAQVYTGSQVVVTQMHIGDNIWNGIKSAGSTAKKYSTALLLAAESVLTIAAGVAGCTINPITGAVAIIIGVLKGVRAVLSFLNTKNNADDAENKAVNAKRKNWADAIRGVEAGLAVILALTGIPNPDVTTWTKVTSTLFASVKSFRSLLILCGADKYVLGQKIINGLQLVEGASLLTGGLAALSASDATSTTKAIGSMGAIVGASKGVRGTEGMVKAHETSVAPVHPGPALAPAEN